VVFPQSDSTTILNEAPHVAPRGTEKLTKFTVLIAAEI
jgi:hypothetical protein